jgi:acetyl esterase/lipase
VQPTTTPAPSATATRNADDVTILENFVYAQAVTPEAEDQLVDIYIPGAPRNYPAIIWAHGSNQDKSTGNILAKLLAKSGFLVLSIDWRDEAGEDLGRGLREAMEDADCALRLARAQAQQVGVNGEQIIWSGFSAGAWLGSLLALGRDNVQNLWEEAGAPADTPPQQVRCVAEASLPPITGFVGSSGVYPLEHWLEPSADEMAESPYAKLKGLAAIGENPSLRVRLIQGSNDVTAPLADAEVFSDALAAAGYDVGLFAQQGGHEPYYQVVLVQIQGLVEE